MKRYINWLIKGLAMGAADVVPGISGGTLAFILGIYERFLHALTSFNLEAIVLLRRGQFKMLWRHIDGAFLLCLFGGILLSIAALANVISYLLEHRPVPLWAFFNGLILAALPWLLRSVHFNLMRIGVLIAGAIFALSISFLSPSPAEPGALLFFLAGFLAICAMILPGISGSFILLLLGMYAPIVAAVSELNIPMLGLFAVGCVLGLLTFSRLLSMLLKRYHDSMLAFLCGVIVGAFYRIWPWQLDGSPVTPDRFATITGQTDMLLAVICFIAGALTIQGLMQLEKIFGNANAELGNKEL